MRSLVVRLPAKFASSCDAIHPNCTVALLPPGVLSVMFHFSFTRPFVPLVPPESGTTATAIVSTVPALVIQTGEYAAAVPTGKSVWAAPTPYRVTVPPLSVATYLEVETPLIETAPRFFDPIESLPAVSANAPLTDVLEESRTPTESLIVRLFTVSGRSTPVDCRASPLKV